MQGNSLKMLQSVALGASARLTRLFGQMTKWSCFLILQPHIKSLKPRKMSIGNHARQSFPIFWIIRHFAFKFIFARLSHGVGWIQHCDVIVFEKFRFRLQSFQKFPLWRAFSVTVFTGYVKKLRFQTKTDTCGRGVSKSRHGEVTAGMNI